MATTFTTETRQSCPAWCRGHYADESSDHLTHHSPMTFAGHVVTASLSLAPDVSPEPLVTVHRHDEGAGICLTQEDARTWALLLAGAGAADLATAIRTTLARLGGAS